MSATRYPKTDKLHVALYVGPAKDITHKIAHEAVCWWTNSEYSHCEIVIDGWGYSASARDGCVRKKQIDFHSGHWDLVPVMANKEFALAFFENTKDLKYDWAGVGRYVFPWLPNPDTRWYCSEWCPAALGWTDIEMTPGQVGDYALSLSY